MNIHQQRAHRQPLCALDLNPTEPSCRMNTPNQKGFTKTNTLASDAKLTTNYNIQFKVGIQQENSRINCENQTHSKPQPSQAALMSPLHPRRETMTQLVKSPLQRNESQHHLLQSPFQQPQLHNRGLSQQKAISFTTTTNVQQELIHLRESNSKLQQKVLQLESEISRRNSSNFIRELESKIKLLTQLNEKLQKDNLQLMNIQDLETLKRQRKQLEQERTQLEIKYQDVLQAFEQYDCEKLIAEMENGNDCNSISTLVTELENKILGLIEENDHLNSQILAQGTQKEQVEQLELEVQQQQFQLQKHKHEESQWRLRYDQLNLEMKKRSQASLQSSGSSFKHQEQIKLLKAQNEKLRSLLNAQNYEDEIKDLEDRIEIIASENKKLEQQILDQ